MLHINSLLIAGKRFWRENVPVASAKEIDFGLIKYEYLNKSENPILLDYIKEKALELANSEGIPIYFISYDELNQNETNEDEKAVGRFLYFKNKTAKAQYEYILNTLNSYKTPPKIDRKRDYPRIEISDRASIFTILHELGHYFMYKNEVKQTEEGANAYIEEFFDKYLLPFFKWIYQVELEVKCKKERNFSLIDCYNHNEAYKKFIKTIKNEKNN